MFNGGLRRSFRPPCERRPFHLALAIQYAPPIRYGTSNRQDAFFKPRQQIIFKPPLQFAAPLACRKNHQSAPPQFANRPQRLNREIVHLVRRPISLRRGRDGCGSVPKGCSYRAENRSRQINRASCEWIAAEIKYHPPSPLRPRRLLANSSGNAQSRVDVVSAVRRRRLQRLQNDIFRVLIPTALKTLLMSASTSGLVI